jgi:hypothetical protein
VGVVSYKFTDVSEVFAASIIRAILIIEAASTSETSVYLYRTKEASITEMQANLYQTTRRKNPDDSSHLRTRRRENLKSGTSGKIKQEL